MMPVYAHSTALELKQHSDNFSHILRPHGPFNATSEIAQGLPSHALSSHDRYGQSPLTQQNIKSATRLMQATMALSPSKSMQILRHDAQIAKH